MQVDGLDARRARALYNAGLKTPQAVAEADGSLIKQALAKALPISMQRPVGPHIKGGTLAAAQIGLGADIGANQLLLRSQESVVSLVRKYYLHLDRDVARALEATEAENVGMPSTLPSQTQPGVPSPPDLLGSTQENFRSFSTGRRRMSSHAVVGSGSLARLPSTGQNDLPRACDTSPPALTSRSSVPAKVHADALVASHPLASTSVIQHAYCAPVPPYASFASEASGHCVHSEQQLGLKDAPKRSGGPQFEYMLRNKWHRSNLVGAQKNSQVERAEFGQSTSGQSMGEGSHCLMPRQHLAAGSCPSFPLFSGASTQRQTGAHATRKAASQPTPHHIGHASKSADGCAATRQPPAKHA